MGMFDIVMIEYPLPEIDPVREWQTHGLECEMERYTITKDGRLIHHATRQEVVPENERPYYGTPDWDTHPVLQICGMLKSIPTGDVDTEYHGDLYVIGSVWSKDNTKIEQFVEYKIRFTHGSVESVTRLDRAA